jgi:hypothetical protein
MGNVVLAASSVFIALSAVVVAVWQVRVSARAAERSNALPILSAAFDEFRSAEFQGHLRRVWNEAPGHVPEKGFQALPDEWRASAYRVAYFFEHLGLLVAYELVPKDSIVDFSANLVVRSWRALAPFVEAERRYRKRTGDGMSSGFVSHFEHLVALTLAEDGTPVDSEIHERLSLRRMPDSGV